MNPGIEQFCYAREEIEAARRRGEPLIELSDRVMDTLPELESAHRVIPRQAEQERPAGEELRNALGLEVVDRAVEARAAKD
jgi:hypothetical protein